MSINDKIKEMQAEIAQLKKDKEESEKRDETLRKALNKLGKRIADLEGRPSDDKSIFEMIFGK